MRSISGVASRVRVEHVTLHDVAIGPSKVGDPGGIAGKAAHGVPGGEERDCQTTPDEP